MKDSNAMETMFSSTTPAKLYALLLKLHLLQRDTLMPFSGELVYGVWLHWLRSAAPDMVTWLHDGNKRHLFTCSSLERCLQEDGVIIADYEFKPHNVRFTTHPQLGFVGTCEYHLRGPDEETTPDAPLTVRQQLLLLAHLAFYCGIGYKTSMGMGQARIREKG